MYYRLTKPGIIYGNLVTAAGGFLLAAKWHFSIIYLLLTLLGIGLVIASACVTNNYLDRSIDAKMARTKQRALVSGAISGQQALCYAAALGLLGFTDLLLLINRLTALVGLVAWLSYVVLYGIGKRRTVYGTLIGSVSGALPPVGGYTAVTNRLDTAALLLFLVLVMWQMPHFYAIAMYRLKDYRAAGIPVWPAQKGMRSTKLQMMVFIALFTITCGLFTVFHYTGVVFLVVMLIIGGIWFGRGLQGFSTNDDVAWARKMFLFSLIVTLVLSLMLSLGSVLA